MLKFVLLAVLAVAASAAPIPRPQEGGWNTAGFNTAGFNTAGFNTVGFNTVGFNTVGFNTPYPSGTNDGWNVPPPKHTSTR